MSEHSPNNCVCASCESDMTHMRFFASQCTDTMEPKPGVLYRLGCPCRECTKLRQLEQQRREGYEH